MKVLTAVLGVMALILAASTYYFYSSGSTSSEELVAIKSGYLQLDKQVDLLGKEKTELTSELERLRNNNAKLNTQLGQIAQNTEHSSGQLEELRTQNKELVKTVTQLEGQKKTIAKKLENAVAELTTTKEEMATKTVAPVEEAKVEAPQFQSVHNKLAGQLKKDVGQKRISLSPSTKRLSISISEKSLFDSGRTEIKPKGQALLTKLGKIIKDSQGANIRVAGHHDGKDLGFFIRANYSTHWELTSARATSITRYLNEQVGINGKRLSAVGLSKYHPVASNKTDKGRSKNRRIEITLYKD